MAPVVEREAKLMLPDGAALPDLHVAPALQISHVHLNATYWDTADRRLLRLGHTLRHRAAADGTEQRWTLKLAGGSASAEERLLARSEVHLNGPSDDVPGHLRGLLLGVVRTAELQPIASILTARGRMVLTDTDGRPLVEIADDQVHATPTGGAEFTFRQIEVEQLDPDSDDLVTEVIALLERAGARRDDRSKLAITLADSDRHDVSVDPDNVTTVVDLVRAAIAASTTRLLLNDAYLRLGDDHDAVHQARVATRRLRSDLRSLRPVLDERRAEQLRDELAWLAGLLGDVRDNDVLRDDVTNAAAGLDGDSAEGVSELLAGLSAEGTPHRLALSAALDGTRYLDLVDALAEAVLTPPLADGIEPDKRARKFAVDITRAAWKRTANAVARLGPHPAPDELHEIRKRIKRARYASELAALVHGRDAREFAARLATVQDSLGDLHDAHMAEAWLCAAVARHALTGAGGFAAGRLAESEHRRAAADTAWRAEWAAAARPKRRAWLSR